MLVLWVHKQHYIRIANWSLIRMNVSCMVVLITYNNNYSKLGFQRTSICRAMAPINRLKSQALLNIQATLPFNMDTYRIQINSQQRCNKIFFILMLVVRVHKELYIRIANWSLIWMKVSSMVVLITRNNNYSKLDFQRTSICWVFTQPITISISANACE